MQNTKLLLLPLLFLFFASCQDEDTFTPSYNLDEYVTLAFDDVSRLYTSEDFIKVQLNQEHHTLHIGLWPAPYGSYDLAVRQPKVGTFITPDASLFVMDYPLEENDTHPYFILGCDYAPNSCNGNLRVVIHRMDGPGGKLMGEYSGYLPDQLYQDTSMQSFRGEFVVNIPE